MRFSSLILGDLELQEAERKRAVLEVQRDLHTLAVSRGQTAEQATAKVDALFAAFAAEWSLYILTGSPVINTAITNDATLAWLDTDVQGTSLRTRLLNRLA